MRRRGFAPRLLCGVRPRRLDLSDIPSTALGPRRRGDRVPGITMRRRTFVAMLAGVALFAAAAPARAADYPNRSVRVVVPYPAGGPTDLIARLAAQMLTESLGQDFFVENVSGASGVRGAQMVAAAPADGYTLMVVANDLAIAPAISTKVGYDPLKNFAPISIISRSPSVLLLHPSVPAKTVQEFVTLARADPAKYSYASMSLGQNLLNTERLFRLTLKLPIVRIPFPGAAPILSSTAAGHTLVAYIGLPPATPFIKEGTLQALAVTSLQRSPIAPDVPTMAESGLTGQETELVIGLVAPARTPLSIVELLAGRMAEFVARPQTQERLAVFGFTAVGSTPGEFAAQIKSDIDRAAAVVREAGIKVD
jgi:tripartite-type tricarboxylate transporter receptor subunit TctC